jgi:endogenous inhibitor of DNA gyrase (YacG/DUF329 family)
MPFVRQRGHVKQRFCSIKCKGLAHRDRPSRTCPQCGQSFSVHRKSDQIYCGRKCSLAALAQKKKNRLI